MLIKSLYIKGYGLFDSIGLKSLQAKLTSHITTILGDNGCGKSSLLRALTPYSQDKNHYGGKGMISLEIEHNNETYTVGVDYREKYPYFFKTEDGINLNENGGTHHQNHLVEETFGYSSDLDKLLRFEYRMARMTPASRKEFLMKFNPHELNLILDLQKKIASSLRAIKSNIKLLSQRQSVLESTALDKVTCDELRKQVDLHTKLYHQHDKDISILQVQIDEHKEKLKALTDKHPALKNTTFEQFKKSMGVIRSILLNLWREHNSLLMNTKYKTMDVASLDTEIREVESTIIDKMSRLKQYQTYQSLDLDKEITPRKERLKVIEGILSGMSKKKCFDNIGVDDLKKVLLVSLPSLIDANKQLTEIGSYIHHPSAMIKIQNKVYHLKAMILNFGMTLHNYQKDMTSLTSSMEIISQEKYPSDCLIVTCNLRQNIDVKMRNWKSQYDQTLVLFDKLDKKKSRYQGVLYKLETLIQELSYHQPHLDIYRDLNRDYPWLIEALLEGDKLFDLLNKNKPKLTSRINLLQEQLKNQLTIITLEEERRDILVELTKLEDPNIPVKSLIAEFILNLSTDIEVSHQKIQRLEKLMLECITHKEVSEDYQKHLDQLIATKELYMKWLEHLCYSKELDVYTFIMDFLIKSRGESQQVLISNESVLKEQDNIRMILDSEIIPVLKDLKSKEVEYTLLDAHMGPSGLPKQYLISYINNIIINANRILAQSWSYDLQLVPLTMTSEIDFQFKRIVNGIEAADISMCSDSQKDIIDIAWNIAMIISLGYGKNYPVYFDEIDKHFDEGHRERLIDLIANQVRYGNLAQVFLVNHHAALSGGLAHNQTVVLSHNNISVPEVYNVDVILQH